MIELPIKLYSHLLAIFPSTMDSSIKYLFCKLLPTFSARSTIYTVLHQWFSVFMSVNILYIHWFSNWRVRRWLHTLFMRWNNRKWCLPSFVSPTGPGMSCTRCSSLPYGCSWLCTNWQNSCHIQGSEVGGGTLQIQVLCQVHGMQCTKSTIKMQLLTVYTLNKLLTV